MKRKYVQKTSSILTGIILLSFAATVAVGQYPSNLKMLSCGQIKPLGWIYEQMKADLESGYIVEYDKISPMASQDVFVTGQGEYTAPIERNVPSWWLGEVEGLWKESITKLAFLTGNKEHQQASADWIYRIMEHQGEDGYIEMYNPEVRLNHVIEKVMQPESETVNSNTGGLYYKRGPLVFALPLESELKQAEELGKSGFYRWDVIATEETSATYSADPAEEFNLAKNDSGDSRFPWVNPPISLKGQLVDAQGQKVDVTLVPQACSILRRVTFPVRAVAEE